MIAPGLAMRAGQLPPEEAKHGFGSCQSAGVKLKTIKCIFEIASRVVSQE
jgi:hypothetical protein